MKWAVAALVLGLGLYALNGWNEDRLERHRISERAARRAYAKARTASLDATTSERPSLEDLQELRADFVAACRACASRKKCESEARNLDFAPETAGLASSCP